MAIYSIKVNNSDSNLIIQPINMEGPFFGNISEIHDSEGLYQSQFTAATIEKPIESTYHERRLFAKGVLSNWGLKIGDLPYSVDNQYTLNAILELINYRQKQIIFRSKTKQQIDILKYDKEKFRSYLQQAQRNIQELNKKFGRLQNQNTELKSKAKNSENKIKKQRQEDKKMICALRNKNEQVMHEMKKKQQEVNRVKQQMKKSVGQKGLANAKNSFEVFHIFHNQSDKRDVNSPAKSDSQKYGYLLERNQKELLGFKKENNLLRQKIYDIKEQIVSFIRWIDTHIYGENAMDNHKKYNNIIHINHNFLFKRQSIVDQLIDAIELAKDGILQLQDIYRRNKIIPKSNQKSVKSYELLKFNEEQENQKNFKKKGPVNKMDHPMTDRIRNSEFQTNLKQDLNHNQRRKKSFADNSSKTSDNMSPRSIKMISSNAKPKIQTYGTWKKNSSKTNNTTTESKPNIKSDIEYKNIINKRTSNPILTKTGSAKVEHKWDEDEMLSQVIEDHDSSIISHISSSQMLFNDKLSKWDILYNKMIDILSI